MTRGYQQFCGLARALDLVGGRWALLIVRDLLNGPKRFGQLQNGLPGIPTNVLTTRLRELEDAGVVQRRLDTRPRRGVVYELTEFGRELEEPLLRLGFWGAKALGAREEGDFVSVDSLALALRGAFHPDEAEGPPGHYELRVDGKSLRIEVDDGNLVIPSASTNEPDLVVEAEPDVLAQLLTGRLDLDQTRKSGRLRLHGTLAEARRMLRMFRFPSAHPA
jgi:DNA-binding HxlR family transcriptional regulator/putative sterol carrier protein